VRAHDPQGGVLYETVSTGTMAENNNSHCLCNSNGGLLRHDPRRCERFRERISGVELPDPSLPDRPVGATVPCFVALVEFWGICSRIAEDNSFCRENAGSLQIIGKLALLDTIVCFAVTIFLCLNHACNPPVILLSFGVMIAGTAIAIAAMTLSHLVDEAIKKLRQTL